MYDSRSASRRARRGRPGLTRRRAGALSLLGILATLLLATGATARPPTQPRPLTAADFHPITLPPDPSFEPVADARPGQLQPLAPIPDLSSPSRTDAPRPTPAQPTVERTQSKMPPVPRQPAVHLTGHAVSGSATWYCKAGVSACHSAYSGGFYAAAGPELRVGDWRGRVVRVCANGRCVNVRLIDWCACGGNHVIDLYSDAFQRLAPLDAGAVRVRVSW